MVNCDCNKKILTNIYQLLKELAMGGNINCDTCIKPFVPKAEYLYVSSEINTDTVPSIPDCREIQAFNRNYFDIIFFFKTNLGATGSLLIPALGNNHLSLSYYYRDESVFETFLLKRAGFGSTTTPFITNGIVLQFKN